MTAISPIKLTIARSVGALSRASGRGGGTSLPGKVLLKLDRDAIAGLAGPLDRSVAISATNGKTTTAALLSSVLSEAGSTIVHNHAGANMPGGIASALLQASGRSELSGGTGIFEIDEAWVAGLVEQLRPDVVVLSNLFRDQLDRYGELETLADSWTRMIAGLPAETIVVINADDPLLAQLPGEDPHVRVLYFGVQTDSCAEVAPRHAADSKFCRRCGSSLTYDLVQLAHLGSYRCDSCGLSRPTPDVSVSDIELHGMRGSNVTIETPTGQLKVELPIPGLYNIYNALAATATAVALEIPAKAIGAGLNNAKAVFGRVETLSIHGHDVSLLLIKNPTGANEVLRTITAGDDSFDLWISLNDKIADGRDISWVWDADFELLAGKVGRVTCSGTRAEELALRLAYAGVERERLQIDGRIEQSFDDALDAAAATGARIFALPTYTSLLELRTAIARRGDAPQYWSK